MPRTPPGRRDAYRVFHRMPTRWTDNDAYGHMNNAIHYMLFDTAVTFWQIDQGVFDLSGRETRLVVVESGCVYHAEAGFPDLVHAGLCVGHVGTSSWRYDIGLFRNDEDSAFAEGFFVQVQVNAGTGRPEPLAPALRAALARITSPARP